VEHPSQSHSPNGEDKAGPPTVVTDRSQNVSSTGRREVMGHVLQEADSTTLESEGSSSSSSSRLEEKRVATEEMECEDAAQAASVGEGEEVGSKEKVVVERMATVGRQEAAAMVVGEHVTAVETGQCMADKDRDDGVGSDNAGGSVTGPGGSQTAAATVGEAGEMDEIPAGDPQRTETQENRGSGVSGIVGVQRVSDESRAGRDSRTEPSPAKIEVIRSSASNRVVVEGSKGHGGHASPATAANNRRTGASLADEGLKDAVGADEATGEAKENSAGDRGRATDSGYSGSSSRAGLRETTGGSETERDEVSMETGIPPGASGRDLEGEAAGAATWEDVGVRVVDEEDWVVVDVVDTEKVCNERNIALQAAATDEDNSARPTKRPRLEGDTGEKEEESNRGTEEPVAKQLRLDASGENGGAAEMREIPRRREEISVRTEAGEETEVSYKEAATGQMEKVEGKVHI